MEKATGAIPIGIHLSLPIQSNWKPLNKKCVLSGEIMWRVWNMEMLLSKILLPSSIISHLFNKPADWYHTPGQKKTSSVTKQKTSSIVFLFSPEKLWCRGNHFPFRPKDGKMLQAITAIRSAYKMPTSPHTQKKSLCFSFSREKILFPPLLAGIVSHQMEIDK